MQAFDELPRHLRICMAQAALPWSPTSCHRIWARACARGVRPEDILDRLARRERITLSRDWLSPAARLTPLGCEQDHWR